MKLDEESLKCQMLAMLRRKRLIKNSSIIASEFVLGQTGCRSDLAIWNGKFIGVEVKSARDSLARLPEQIRAYQKFFDEVILLCDETHLAKAEVLCPDGVGIYVWRQGEIQIYRTPRPLTAFDRFECVRSLSIKQLHSSIGLKSGQGFSRSSLECQVLSDPSIDVRSLVVASFEMTYLATSQAFLSNASGKRITPDQLRYLSRFADSRDEMKRSNADRQVFWKRWEEQAQAVFS